MRNWTYQYETVQNIISSNVVTSKTSTLPASEECTFATSRDKPQSSFLSFFAFPYITVSPIVSSLLYLICKPCLRWSSPYVLHPMLYFHYAQVSIHSFPSIEFFHPVFQNTPLSSTFHVGITRIFSSILLFPLALYVSHLSNFILHKWTNLFPLLKEREAVFHRCSTSHVMVSLAENPLYCKLRTLQEHACRVLDLAFIYFLSEGSLYLLKTGTPVILHNYKILVKRSSSTAALWASNYQSFTKLSSTLQFFEEISSSALTPQELSTFVHRAAQNAFPTIWSFFVVTTCSM